MIDYAIFNRITNQQFNISNSIQQSLFLAKYNNQLCFFFLDFVSCRNLIVNPKSKENNKENIEVIKPSNISYL